jgi:hypothetical protein
MLAPLLKIQSTSWVSVAADACECTPSRGLTISLLPIAAKKVAAEPSILF